MSKLLRIGIVGTGGIAIHFANACHMVNNVEVNGVFSPTPEKRAEFLKITGVRHAYESLEDLLASRQIDLVYIATPHSTHYNIAMAALCAGKNVLCEKPLCTNAAQAEELFKAAERKNLFLMEGLWSRFLPVTQMVTSWIEEEKIGEIRFIDAQFSFSITPPIPRLFDPQKGGGAMFDVGVYAIEMASWYEGTCPIEWHGVCKAWGDGVDASSALVLRYQSGALATLRMGIDCAIPEEMTIYGEKGYIKIPKFHRPNEAFLHLNDGGTESFSRPFLMPEGFVWEILEVQSCIEKGQRRCKFVLPEDSISSAKIMCGAMHSFFPDYY